MRDFATLLSRVAGNEDRSWRWLLGEIARIARWLPHTDRLCDADRGDLVQTVALIIVERLPMRDPDCLFGWLTTTLGRQALRIRARRDRHVLLRQPGHRPARGLTERSSPETFVLTRERDRALWLATTRLPSARARRLVWLLAHYPELTQQQLADELGIAPGSVGPLRRRSLNSLRSELGSQGYGPSDLQ